MLKFMVKWHTGGMDVKHSEHKQFVEDLCAQFSPLIISVIDNVLSEDESKVRRGHCRLNYCLALFIEKGALNHCD